MCIAIKRSFLGMNLNSAVSYSPVNSSVVAVFSSILANSSSLLVGEDSIGFPFVLSSLLWAWL